VSCDLLNHTKNYFFLQAQYILLVLHLHPVSQMQYPVARREVFLVGETLKKKLH